MSSYYEPSEADDAAAIRSYENDVLYRGTAAEDGEEDSDADA